MAGVGMREPPSSVHRRGAGGSGEARTEAHFVVALSLTDQIAPTQQMHTQASRLFLGGQQEQQRPWACEWMERVGGVLARGKGSEQGLMMLGARGGAAQASPIARLGVC